ncbi:spore coat associated protein CotJA [Tissierella sp. MSJ-40]|uniref:Spore coat associated protein CotJA n=1 Tax=Tissierella simiarum TaxID=2841534 RepID=A0ABS6E6L9_9FIRM|nr:spore coat associated protein CotJA [Tissierella simiarum]MBU5438557.1 spore coat associated protein CotJA [Tissierella simiarum]
MNTEHGYDRRANNELARAYIPFQTMNQVYDPREALKRGTLFPELYRPYIVDESKDRGGRYYG